MTTILSIILPCYNVEKYISECLQSLYSQDISEDIFEIICVNDCSSDNTRSIITEYQPHHHNLVVIDHLENQKQGGARNTGVDSAKGKYIWFVDSDDLVSPNTLTTILSTIENYDLDLIYFDYRKFDELNGNIEVPHVTIPANVILTGKDVLEANNFYDVTSLSWIRICTKQLLIENKIRFYSHFYMEDITYGIRCFLKANKVMYFPLTVYNYRVTPGSVMQTGITGIKTASYLKLAYEYYILSQEVQQPNLKNRFKEISRFYLKSIEKPVLYLPRNERRIFLSLVDEYVPTAFMAQLDYKGLNNFTFINRNTSKLFYPISAMLNTLKRWTRLL